MEFVLTGVYIVAFWEHICDNNRNVKIWFLAISFILAMCVWSQGKVRQDWPLRWAWNIEIHPFYFF